MLADWLVFQLNSHLYWIHAETFKNFNIHFFKMTTSFSVFFYLEVHSEVMGLNASCLLLLSYHDLFNDFLINTAETLKAVKPMSHAHAMPPGMWKHVSPDLEDMYIYWLSERKTELFRDSRMQISFPIANRKMIAHGLKMTMISCFSQQSMIFCWNNVHQTF